VIQHAKCFLYAEEHLRTRCFRVIAITLTIPQLGEVARWSRRIAVGILLVAVGVLLPFCVFIAWVKLHPEDYDPKNIDYELCVGAEIRRNYCFGSFFNSHASLQQLIRGLRW
jgi:hypothetical protein